MLFVGLLLVVTLVAACGDTTLDGTPGFAETPGAGFPEEGAATEELFPEESATDELMPEETDTSGVLPPSTVTESVGVEEPVTGAETYTDLDSLLAALGADASSVVMEPVSEPYFSVEGQAVDINGEQVHVYEFPDEETAQLDADLVSADGTMVGDVTVNGTPHFYQAGRFIVVYMGDDPATIDLLEASLGPPFAGA